MRGRGTAEVGVRDEYAREAVEGAVVDATLGAPLLLVLAAQRGRVLGRAQGEGDGAEALLDQSLHERVWRPHHHLLLLLLWLLHLRWGLGRAVRVRGLAGAVRVSVRHGWRECGDDDEEREAECAKRSGGDEC